jgi:hypothetical protein
MRLSLHQIDIFSFRIAKQLLRNGFIKGINEDRLAERISDVITTELRREDDLNDEVRQILDRYADQMQEAGAQYHEMFKKIKAKLVRERNIIL